MRNSLGALDSLRDRLASPMIDKSDHEQENWMVSYADLITLLFIFFSVMLSISSISRAKSELLTREFNQASTASLASLKKNLDQEIQKQSLQSQVETQISDEGLQIRFSEKVLFASGEAELNPEGRRALGHFAELLSGATQGQDGFRIAVEGHTDSRPIHNARFPSNWELSAHRSVHVLHFLAAHGISEKSMVVRAYADTRPLSPEAVSPGDRRVTLLVHSGVE